MPDLIKLLPDSVANQIAAGEVIQRPASAVKEILENAIDAGATDIKLNIRDAGKTLIQIVDNGCGMSETDARMSFERHATSKIRNADDLFAIKTMGFRGEALASIAAIAQVEIKTRRIEDELGTLIQIEGSRLIDQKPASCPAGTSISIKNLFYNVPARRKFLKSNTAEFRHVIEEFQRVALVNPEISCSLIHNDKIVFQLPKTNLKQRIINLFGAMYSEKIIPVEQKTEKFNISGFIGKPEFAKKTRGEQYFFANSRFIKHPYLHHAVDGAFRELLPNDSFPAYFIYIDVSPANIDINIHPTKTEVNFQDSQLLYAMLRSAIKQSLGRYNIIPAIDFDIEQSFEHIPENSGRAIRNPFEPKESTYNPFETDSFSPAQRTEKKNSDWEKLYEVIKSDRISPETRPAGQGDPPTPEESGISDSGKRFAQIHSRYIVTTIKSGLLIVDIHNAHLRILYERFLNQLEENRMATQKELFPHQMSFSAEDAEILKDIRKDLVLIGFSIKDLGKNTFVIDGTPADCTDQDINQLLEGIIENYKNNLQDLNIERKIKIARALASNLALKQQKPMQVEEMELLIEKLFSCSIPEKTPDGRATIFILPFNELEKKFN